MSDLSQNTPKTIQNWKKWFFTPWTITLTIPVLVALFDNANLIPILSSATQSFMGTLPYIVVAVLLLSYLKAAGAETMVAKAFQGKENRMIFLAAIFGGLAPFCSCQVIPFIAGLLALGAPLSAVMAFWLSSPLIDPPTLLITAGALGWSYAIFKAFAAVGLGLFGGYIVKLAMQGGALTKPLRNYSKSGCGCGPNPVDGKPLWKFWSEQNRRKTFREQFAINALFLIKWLALAYMLEAVLITYVPASLIATVVGGEGIRPVIIGAFVGMPAYLNSYVAPPLLAGLIEQGMSTGAAMSFMIAGAVSSIPAMAAVWSLVKPQVFALYLSLGVSGAIISGLIFQLIV